MHGLMLGDDDGVREIATDGGPGACRCPYSPPPCATQAQQAPHDFSRTALKFWICKVALTGPAVVPGAGGTRSKCTAPLTLTCSLSRAVPGSRPATGPPQHVAAKGVYKDRVHSHNKQQRYLQLTTLKDNIY